MTKLAIVSPGQCSEFVGTRPRGSVRGVGSARASAGRHAGPWIEAGPGKVPAGPSNRIDTALVVVYPMYEPATHGKALQEMRNAE